MTYNTDFRKQQFDLNVSLSANEIVTLLTDMYQLDLFNVLCEIFDNDRSLAEDVKKYLEESLE